MDTQSESMLDQQKTFQEAVALANAEMRKAVQDAHELIAANVGDFGAVPAPQLTGPITPGAQPVIPDAAQLVHEAFQRAREMLDDASKPFCEDRESQALANTEFAGESSTRGASDGQHPSTGDGFAEFPLASAPASVHSGRPTDAPGQLDDMLASSMQWMDESMQDVLKALHPSVAEVPSVLKAGAPPSSGSPAAR